MWPVARSWDNTVGVEPFIQRLLEESATVNQASSEGGWAKAGTCRNYVVGMKWLEAALIILAPVIVLDNFRYSFIIQDFFRAEEQASVRSINNDPEFPAFKQLFCDL